MNRLNRSWNIWKIDQQHVIKTQLDLGKWPKKSSVFQRLESVNKMDFFGANFEQNQPQVGLYWPWALRALIWQ